MCIITKAEKAAIMRSSIALIKHAPGYSLRSRRFVELLAVLLPSITDPLYHEMYDSTTHLESAKRGVFRPVDIRTGFETLVHCIVGPDRIEHARLFAEDVGDRYAF